MRTYGRVREENQEGQGTRKSNNKHIALILPTIPDNHSPDLLCDNVVEYTAGWKWNIYAVISKGNSYGTPYGLQETLYSRVWMIY